MPPTRRKLTPVPKQASPVRQKPPDLRDAVGESLSKMDWLAASDGALRALAQRLADEIEQAADRAAELTELMGELGGDRDMFRRLQRLEAMCDVTKIVGWLGPQLQGVLRDLGGTPAARAAMKTDKPIGGRLAELRSSAAGKHNP
jgi:hypothetical protein